MVRFYTISALILIASLGATACASDRPSDRASSTSAQPAPPKVLTIAVQRELRAFGSFVESGGGTVAPDLAHNTLVVKNHEGAYIPQLASELPSPDRGTWRLNPDGSMETTWKLRPGIRWHDGAPFTSDDLLFTYQVHRDPELPSGAASQMRSMESASAPDPLTFVVRWSRVEVKADQAIGLDPLPRHLLKDQYEADKLALPNSPYFTADFVGLGPYRLASWESGATMAFIRFDGYYFGRPPLDRVVLRFIADPAAMVASILAGAVDVVIPPGIDTELAIDVQERWQGTGNQVVVRNSEDFNGAYAVQVRPEYARPRDGLTNRDVREALYRAIDRQAMADAMTHKLAPLADSWIPPGHPLRAETEAAIPQYPYDPARAQQILRAAGWTRGPDGVLVYATTRDRFETEVAGPQRAVIQKQAPIIADNWRAIGVAAEVHLIPPALDADRKYEATRPGVLLGSIAVTRFLFENQLHSREALSDANNWRGRNKGGYGNVVGDDLLDRLASTIDPRERAELHRQLLRAHLGDVATMPFYWEVYPALALASVKAPIYPAKSGGAWNIFEWDKQ